MRKLFLTVAVVALVGCGAAMPAAAHEGEFFGTITGATLGGLLGSQFGHGDGRLAYTGAGVFLGGMAGNDIGRSMDRTERYYARPAYGYSYYSPAPVYYAAPAYVPNYVAPEPPPSYIYEDEDSYCREFSQQVRIGNRIQESYGTACLQPDGSWRIVQ